MKNSNMSTAEYIALEKEHGKLQKSHDKALDLIERLLYALDGTYQDNLSVDSAIREEDAAITDARQFLETIENGG